MLSNAFLTRLQALHAEVNAEHKRLGRLLSAADREVNSLYHAIERAPAFDEAAVRRRILKDESLCLVPIRLMFAEDIADRVKHHRRVAARSAAIRAEIKTNLSEGFPHESNV